ncbi:MAG: hypothetical protein H7Y04_06600, partial [Verrucomicrobia bacterium]|nr:hypothetical protein [Cytophagales bacterium]
MLKKIFPCVSHNAFLCWLGGLFMICIFPACAPENNSFAGRIWHNTNAHYNAYFLAKEKLKEMDAQILKERKDNYTQLLDIIIPVDTNYAKNLKTFTDYAIKKSSLAIQHHKISKWTDDDYLIVGKARLYQADLGNAIQTFKYVNAQSPDEAVRHRAMIGLLQAFIWQKEYEKARAAIAYIRKEKLDKANTAEFYLVRSQLYKELEDYAKTAAAIKLALPLMKRGERKARTHFIAGQLYQTLEKNKEAYKNYKAALKYNPSFELDFNIRLNLIETYQTKTEKDARKLVNLFKKMLYDEKNKEFKDQVYYKIGLYELKEKHYEKAIGYLKQSVAVSKSNTTQKSLSYLKMAEVYYENLQQYELSSAYYDSTLTILPKNFKSFQAVSKRQQVLKSFVENLNTVRREDSLQALARMTPED